MSTNTKPWIARNLKPGDEVAVAGSRFGGLTIAAVQRITPGGQIVLENGDRFTKSGSQIGTGAHAGRRYLSAVTDAIRETVARVELINRLRRRLDKWEQLPIETLERVEAALSGTETP